MIHMLKFLKEVYWCLEHTLKYTFKRWIDRMDNYMTPNTIKFFINFRICMTSTQLFAVTLFQLFLYVWKLHNKMLTKNCYMEPGFFYLFLIYVLTNVIERENESENKHGVKIQSSFKKNKQHKIISGW